MALDAIGQELLAACLATLRAYGLTRSSISCELSPYFMEIPNPLEVVFLF
jgi:hypothetical protein